MWSKESESNRPDSALQADALPLGHLCLVGQKGVEPSIFGLLKARENLTTFIRPMHLTTSMLLAIGSGGRILTCDGTLSIGF
jgi:hypothetical protein